MDKETGKTEQLLHALMRGMRVRKKDLAALRLYAEPEMGEKAVKALFSGLDLNAEPFWFCILLSHIGAKTGWKGVPEEIRPRLSGLRKELGFKNTSLAASAMGYFRMLCEAGVPVLLVKGGAMRLGLLPGMPRLMSDIDIAVPPARFEECLKIAEAAGFSVPGHVVHSADIKKDGASLLDLHCSMFKSNVRKPEPLEEIRGRGKRLEKQNVSLYVPSPEDAFLHALTSGAEDYFMRSQKGPVACFTDCVALAETYPLDFQMVADHAREYGVVTQFRIGARLLERFLPDAFPALYKAAEGEISQRAAGRMLRGMKFRRLSSKEIRGLPDCKRALYMLRLFRTDVLCIYRPEDPPLSIMRGWPDLLRTWFGVKKNREIPAELRRILRKWTGQKRGHS